MKVEYYKEWSSVYQRELEFKVFGHAGKPCIAFPSQDGRFFDYENRGIIDSMSWYIEQGKIQVFCVESMDQESFSATYKSGYDRIRAQEAYYEYIIKDIVPRVYEINTYGNGGGVASGIMTFGVSLGAYHAVNFIMRRPDIFDAVLALSGVYDSYFFIQGYSDELMFLNSPVESLKNMAYNHPYVNMYKNSRIVICVGQGNWEEECLKSTREMDTQLHRLGIPAWCDYWGYDKPHDWPSWLEQVPYFLYHILD